MKRAEVMVQSHRYGLLAFKPLLILCILCECSCSNKHSQSYYDTQPSYPYAYSGSYYGNQSTSTYQYPLDHPSAKFKPISPLSSNENVSIDKDHAYFGIGTEDCKNSSDKMGVYIVEFFEDSEAERRGLKIGDRIIAINERRIESSAQLTKFLQKLVPETLFTITYERSGSTYSESVKPISKIIPDYRKRFALPRKRTMCQTIGLYPTRKY